jgi:hypothetical protein
VQDNCADRLQQEECDSPSDSELDYEELERVHCNSLSAGMHSRHRRSRPPCMVCIFFTMEVAKQTNHPISHRAFDKWPIISSRFRSWNLESEL